MSTILMMSKAQALALLQLLEQAREDCRPDEYAFDKTSLGELLRAMKGGPQ